ncbi:hypothetical protein ATE49_11260 [Elizabethkingia miricola]|uniref:AraC-like DNA-binding protein n=2 Tax=Elizabethkingia miricola TaxID=172045 RepID=A0ABY3NKZ2_ELIMR|nr:MULTISPECIES: helix-turn-helix domain-containing protein [Elizabethkingia]NHQ67329.1 AraC family transcriptional regulator [Elizabethkingia miricola]NHQ71080.1 AraC family transcriptional regulator [Elizabethkingia miricola]OBS13600.1 hypothetical protein ATE49_11260 [Elizabethkingia miricola]OPC54464.1 hypothetical protein BAY06_12085 [Elizabethkingia anophelis]PSL86831.1 AraC family transcriptional regulator [Elizabethkingia miricola]
MRTSILKTSRPELEDIVQYFIFFRSEGKERINYTTFPNTNLCLSIYKKNKVILEQRNKTRYISTLEGNETYVSFISGFYESSLHVDINAKLDEICLIFHPAALRKFTKVSYNELLSSNKVFDLLFKGCDPCFLEKLFENENDYARQYMLESLLLRSIVDNSKTDRIKETLFHISNNKEIRIGDLAKKLSVNESTLYRLFIDQVGQSPKAFLRTIRFRNVLDKLIDHNRNKFSELAYNHNYADQSHLIKDFKEITGETPGQLKKKTKFQQEELAWIYTEG